MKITEEKPIPYPEEKFIKNIPMLLQKYEDRLLQAFRERHICYRDDMKITYVVTICFDVDPPQESE